IFVLSILLFAISCGRWWVSSFARSLDLVHSEPVSTRCCWNPIAGWKGLMTRFTPKICQADGRWAEPLKPLIQKAFLRRHRFYFRSRSGVRYEQNREYGAKL